MAKSKPRKPRPSGGGRPKMPPGMGGAGGAGGGMGGLDMNAMLSQVQQMQADMAATQESLGDEVVEVTAGGGMIKVKATGHQEIVSIELEADIVDPDDIEMLQDMIVAGVNEALRAAKDLAEEKMKGVTGGLDLGGLDLGGMGLGGMLG